MLGVGPMVICYNISSAYNYVLMFVFSSICQNISLPCFFYSSCTKVISPFFFFLNVNFEVIIYNSKINLFSIFFQVSSVQLSVMSDSFRPHGLQHIRLPCPSPTLWSLLKLISIESMMPSNHLIICHPFLLCNTLNIQSNSEKGDIYMIVYHFIKEQRYLSICSHLCLCFSRAFLGFSSCDSHTFLLRFMSKPVNIIQYCSCSSTFSASSSFVFFFWAIQIKPGRLP